MSEDVVYGWAHGNPVTFINEKWTIDLTGEEWTEELNKNLICPRCGEKPTEEGHDPCIANLPGVEYACCGHGVDSSKFKQAYIKYLSGELIRFNTTEKLLEYIKNGKESKKNG